MKFSVSLLTSALSGFYASINAIFSANALKTAYSTKNLNIFRNNRRSYLTDFESFLGFNRSFLVPPLSLQWGKPDPRALKFATAMKVIMYIPSCVIFHMTFIPIIKLACSFTATDATAFAIHRWAFEGNLCPWHSHIMRGLELQFYLQRKNELLLFTVIE